MIAGSPARGTPVASRDNGLLAPLLQIMIDGFLRRITIKHRYRRAAIFARIHLADVHRRAAARTAYLLYPGGELGALGFGQFADELFLRQKIVKRRQPAVPVAAGLIRESRVLDRIVGEPHAVAASHTAQAFAEFGRRARRRAAALVDQLKQRHRAVG